MLRADMHPPTYNIYTLPYTYLPCAGTMAVFPQDWEVYDADDFSSFSADDMQDIAPLGMNMLMLLDKHGRSTGAYRTTLFGGGIIEAHYPLADILHDPPPEFIDKYVMISFKATQITPAQNSTTTAWRDLAILLQARNSNNPPITRDTF